MNMQRSKVYCPHCKALIDNSIIVRPEKCYVCNKPIAWGAYGGTSTPFFNFQLPDLPFAIKDTIIAALAIAAIAYTIYSKFG